MSSILDPEGKPSATKELIHKGKGCLAVIVAAAVLLVGGSLAWNKASDYVLSLGEVPDYTGAGKARIQITVPDGASLDAIGVILVDKGVIRSTRAWDKAVRSEDRATSVQAGNYAMRTQMPATDALRLLINPGTSRIRSQFRVAEGLRLSAQLDALAQGTKIPKAAFQAAVKKPKSLGLPGYAKNRPEGFFFPETYELTAESTATSVLRQMTAQYKEVTADVGFVKQAEANGIRPYDALIVASIIEREVNRAEDRPKVARVLYNRLAKKRKLQLDSTVVYAERLSTNTTTPKDRASKSKYNTYRYKGLPPGPISAPGEAALKAAANPAKGKWLYFVTVNFDTGETKYATSEAGFEKIRTEFQQYCQSNPGKCDS